MSTILESALVYASLGLEVFPVPPGSKRSYKSKATSLEGKNWGATKNPDMIRSYWAEHPDANLGVPTGADNGFWVLEYDTVAGGHAVDGAASLAALETEFGPLPATRQAESPSGSVHFYFQHPGYKITGTPNIRPGIDIRGDGNMVIAPPSVKAGVGAYRWLNDLPVADAPQWLLDLLKTAKASAAAVERAPVNIPPPPSCATPVEKALHTEYHRVAQAPEGTRNHQLNKSSFELGRFVGAGELDEEKAIQTLVNACEANGSFAEEAGECHGTIDSGMRAGKADPVKTVSTMFGGCAQFAATPLDAAQPVDGGTGQVIPFELPPGTPGPLTADEMEATEYDPPGGLLTKLGDRLKSFVLPDYLWDGILMKRFCYSMTAQTGTGKTAIALLLAAHVAIGRSLCGLDIEKGQVIYLAGENPVDVDMRWFGLCQIMGIDPDWLEVAILPFAGPLSKYADVIRDECKTRDIRPALVIVDTAAAYFEGKEGNSNEEQGDYARSLRALTTLPGEPCILVLAHPTKVAKDINEMIPRGGGAFLAEMDGNIGVARGDGGLIAAAAIGKFRGPEFTPLHFALHPVLNVPALFDKKKGKHRATVAAQAVTETGAAALTMGSEQDDIRLLRDIDAHPRDAHRDRATRLGCSHTTVGRRIEKLERRKLVDDSGLHTRLSAKGQKELNDLDTVHQSAPSTVPFPVPMRP
jgi:Bifunctional DNA primase/polymerase, N-terminal/AAA domain